MSDNNTGNVRRGNPRMKLIIAAVVVVLIIVLLVRCVGNCGGKSDYGLFDASYPSLDHDTYQYTGGYYSGSGTANSGSLDLTVAEGVPEKRTSILGNGQDVVTIMVYICGSDLESGGGAATLDIQEMLQAGVSDHVNLILYTGGTKDWQNRQMNSRKNEIYQISGNSLYRLSDDAGNKNMANPDTLSEFIRFCSKNFPANRNMLVLWDHGGGSVSGYGYDEKFAKDAGMDLSEIQKALKDGGTVFDFIGFDACLMGSVETGLAVSGYADYLIGSEETESGYGWYYTDWIRSISDNPSLSTVELGKEIVDGFIVSSAQNGQPRSATLSVTDLAELSYTVPDKLQDFASSVTALIEGGSSGKDYKIVSHARSKARSYGESGGVDQVDLVDFAEQLGIREGAALSEAVRGAVKYNNTSRDMTGSYGLSVFFPYNSSKYVGPAEQVYKSIGMSSEYTRCVQTYAAMELSGQYISGGSGTPFNSLFGIFGNGDYGDSSYYGNSTGNSYSSSSVYDLLGDLMGGDLGGFSSDYGSYDFSFFRNLNNADKIADYLAENQFDESALAWKINEDGQPVIQLTKEQWELVSSVALNMFYDDGEGLIDLGEDNVFEFDKDGNLLGVNDRTWLTIDGHYIAYYYDSMTVDGDQYVIRGHSPILYNGTEAELLLTFDNENPYGYISGIRYTETEAEQLVGKTLNAVTAGEKADLENGGSAETVSAVHEGDTIAFLADFYDYKGNYLDRYVLGDEWNVTAEEPVIGNMDVGKGKALAMFRFTDIYQKQYWTGVIPEPSAK